MEYVVVFLLIIFSIASSSKKKNKQSKTKKPQANAAKKGTDRSKNRQEMKKPAASKMQEKKAEQKKAEQKKAKMEGIDPCHEDMLRPQHIGLHYEESDLSRAEEGEDPCHPGEAISEEGIGQNIAEHIHSGTPLFSQEDVRRGIIVSEILTRPKERRNRMHRYAGRGYGKYTGTDRR